MKNYPFIILVLLCALSCTELPPLVSTGQKSASCDIADAALVADQQKNVLIEEFTGIRCVKCPEGSILLEDLIQLHDHRVIAVSIHAGDFSAPFTQGVDTSLYDFRTDAGNSLLDLLGKPFGYPSAVIDRTVDSTTLQKLKSFWPTAVESALNTSPRVKLHIKNGFDSTTRRLTVNLSVFAQETIAEQDVRLSVIITESGIVDVQDVDKFGKVTDYEHNHVLRDIITNFGGNLITESLEDGASFCKSFSYTIPPEWNTNNCNVIAFIHFGGDNKEVLQAVEAKVN